MAIATPMPKTLGYVGLRWCLSTVMKPRGVGQPLDHAAVLRETGSRAPLKAGSIIVNFRRDRVLRLVAAVLVHLGHLDRAVLEAVDLGVGDPFDRAVAKGAFEQALGVADGAQGPDGPI